MAYERYGDQREDDMEQMMLQQELGAPAPDTKGIDLAAAGPPTSPISPAQSPTGGVAGGKDRGGPMEAETGGPSPMAANVKKAQAAGYTDIEGAGGLKTGDYMGGLEGFNTGAWGSGERGSNTLKNSFGKIASRYDPTQAGAASALMRDPDFQAMFPDAYIVEHPNQDLIDFDGPGGDPPVDVLRGATSGGAGAAWQWGVQDSGGAGAEGGGDPLAGASSGAAVPTDIEGLMNSDVLAKIQQEIARLSEGGQGGDEQALVQQILGGR